MKYCFSGKGGGVLNDRGLVYMAGMGRGRE